MTDIQEIKLIAQIVKRVFKEMPDYPDSKTTLIIDIEKCHDDNYPLDLEGLLKADAWNFLHDILGIRRHMNRETGKIENCFVPRYVATEANT